MDQVVIPDLDRFRIQLNGAMRSQDYLEGKLSTIEKHLPTMIEELLVFGLDKKINEKLASFATK